MAAPLTVRALRVVAVEVPMTYVLGTSRGAFSKAPLLLIDLETEEGITGRSYLWCYVRETMPAITSVLAAVAEMLRGDPVAPPDLWAKLSQRFALMGVQGIVRMAMAGLDVAAWDAVAIAARQPLAQIIGGAYSRASHPARPGESRPGAARPMSTRRRAKAPAPRAS